MATFPDATAIIEDGAGEAGWNDKSALIVALRFINSLGLEGTEKFEAFVREAVAEELGENDTDNQEN